MSRRVEELEAAIRHATLGGFRSNLVARGEARDMIWHDGTLPKGSPKFAETLTEDLLGYGYSLLEHGLELSDLEGDQDIARKAFIHAATAIDAATRRASPNSDSGFHCIIAAASFHLGRLSARAYSLLHSAGVDLNISDTDECLVLLMKRDLTQLTTLVSNFRAGPEASDENLADRLRNLFEPVPRVFLEKTSNEREIDALDIVDIALTDTFMGAVSTALLAFERGDKQLLRDALAQFKIGQSSASSLGMVPQWWSHRLASYLFRELWQTSFHEVIPHAPQSQNGGRWDKFREIFIASLFCRERSEIELWPSQLEAASRVLNTSENLVLSLPTSAGKTRIAELCALVSLAEGQRIVFVTPLRALSAQTETTLRRTFTPLGKTVSTLYGSIGVSHLDKDILRTRDIVVSTPEKLDFALRNDPGILTDVGLIVFDEGHMIGIGAREVRFEVQIQSLLQRPDSSTRRIVCLSAVLPEGDAAADFVGWLTNDRPSGLITSSWRPTAQNFAEVIWKPNKTARFNMISGSEKPYIPQFLVARDLPSKARRNKFPNNQQELTLATAWKLVEDGQTVLVYCPLKASVNALAKEVVKLFHQGALPSILHEDSSEIELALEIGKEWFHTDHEILQCLRLGVAIHHGSLPTTFRKEVEALLQKGILKITISSPTLAQGLNLSASALVIHSLWRNRELIGAAEFRNIIGRAGRAFVDSSGLVVHPMFKVTPGARRNWENMVLNTQLATIQSGLSLVTLALLERIAHSLGKTDPSQLTEYILGNLDWEFPELEDETQKDASTAREAWESQVESLDNAILGLLRPFCIDTSDVAGVLDSVLASSLWTRSIAHHQEPTRALLRAGLVSRSTYIWSKTTPLQRWGYFLAGIGYKTGSALDEKAKDLALNLKQAELFLYGGVDDLAVFHITEFARIALTLPPFAPRKLPENWESVLDGWLRGIPINELSENDTTPIIDFIEDAFVYRLPWALEAFRVRIGATPIADGTLSLNVGLEPGEVAAAVETGSLNKSVTILIRAGFASRSGAISAVSSTSADFTSVSSFRTWLHSERVKSLSNNTNWPSPSSHQLWNSFRLQDFESSDLKWSQEVCQVGVEWNPDFTPELGSAYRVVQPEVGNAMLETASAQRVGRLNIRLNPDRRGLLKATRSSADGLKIDLDYCGPSDLWL